MLKIYAGDIEHTLFEGEAISFTAPGTLGYFQVLKNHAPLLTTLAKGTLTIVPSGKPPLQFDIPGGLCEISSNQCSLLIDSILN